MSKVTGIFVSLKTDSPGWAGTDNHVYVGVVGTVGGREFALAVPEIDDFEEGETVTYAIGQGADVFGGHKPSQAVAALEEMTICQPNVTHVYLRKQGNMTLTRDDAWRLQSAFVYVIGNGPTRIFKTTGPATLANEHGLQVWLGEVAHSGAYRDAQIPINGVAECEDG